MRWTAVVALGGNAITPEDGSGTYAEQAAHARDMARAACTLRERGWQVVLVHGNGPQVGNLVIQHHRAADEVPELPLFCLDAMTEGQLGSLLTLALHEVGGASLPGVASVVTHVIVAADDPAFTNPVKPIGPFLDRAQADRLAAQGWAVAAETNRGYRRVVASPQPLGIVEDAAIRALVEQGTLVIAAGGGGVPVAADGHGYRGVDAVIDKDSSARRLATALGAHALVLVTNVDKVALDFGTPQQRTVTDLNHDDALDHLQQGQFPEGSMGPKVRAALGFIEDGGQAAVITSTPRIGPSLDPDEHRAEVIGTRIVAPSAPLGTTA